MWNHGHPGGWMGLDGSGWSWLMGLHGVLWLLFAGLFLAALIALTRYLWRSGSVDADSALGALERRYAEGTIERQDYLQKREDLTRRDRHFRRRHGSSDPETA